MGSKVFLLLELLMAIVLISSDVAARDLTETSTDLNQSAEEAKETDGFDDAKDGKDQGPGGYGYVSYLPPGGFPDDCCGAYCPYGCCGPIGYRGDCLCCTHAGEAVEANTEAKPHN